MCTHYSQFGYCFHAYITQLWQNVLLSKNLWKLVSTYSKDAHKIWKFLSWRKLILSNISFRFDSWFEALWLLRKSAWKIFCKWYQYVYIFVKTLFTWVLVLTADSERYRYNRSALIWHANTFWSFLFPKFLNWCMVLSFLNLQSNLELSRSLGW